MTKDEREMAISQPELLAKLSPTDREKYLFDFHVYGNAFAEEVNGVWRYVALTDVRVTSLLAQMKPRS